MKEGNKEKRFDFPSGLVRLVPLGEDWIEVIHGDTQLLMYGMGADSRDDFIQYAAEELYAALLAGEEVTMDLVVLICANHNSGNYKQRDDCLTSVTAWGDDGAFELSVVDSVYASIEYDVADTSIGDHLGISFNVGCIGLRLANEERFNLYFESTGVGYLDVEDKKSCRYEFSLGGLELGHIVEQNDYFPSWTKLSGAIVEEAYLDACDVKRGVEYGTESGLATFRELKVMSYDGRTTYLHRTAEEQLVQGS